MPDTHPIGVFDSGYGGLTILQELRKHLPDADYCYLGDNARAPYGTRSFETVYQYTRQCVQWFFDRGCDFVILACNTASAKALRTIQQKDLVKMNPNGKVLGVLRPTTERIGLFTKSGHIGVLATNGTVQSGSYPLEIAKFFPDVKVTQQACPMWVPLVENNEHLQNGADYFVQESLQQILKADAKIDTLLLGCTHYPLLIPKIEKYIPGGVKIVIQGEIVAHSLKDYLQRHPEIENAISKHGNCTYYTTDSTEDFNRAAKQFIGEEVQSKLAIIPS